MLDSGVNPAMDADRPNHLSENELAGLLDRALDAAERLRVETHLDKCAECRREMVEMRRITNGHARGGRGTNIGAAARRRWWIPAALAAGLAALIFLPRLATGPGPRGAPVRGAPVADGEGTVRLGIVTPADNAMVNPGTIVFTWHAATADLFRISVLTESGEPLWTTETTDTTTTLPVSVSLKRGQPYFWRVEAIANGIVATTGVHRLQIAP